MWTQSLLKLYEVAYLNWSSETCTLRTGWVLIILNYFDCHGFCGLAQSMDAYEARSSTAATKNSPLQQTCDSRRLVMHYELFFLLFWILLTLNVGASNGIQPGKIDPFACFSRLPPAVVLEPLQVVGTLWFCHCYTCEASQGWLWAAFPLEPSGTTESRSYVPGFIDVHH